MSQKMTHRLFGPKVHDPSRAAKGALLKLAQERHRRDVCNARLQDLENELQMFSEEFGSRLHDIRVSMRDAVFAPSQELRALSGGEAAGELDCQGRQDVDDKTH